MCGIFGIINDEPFSTKNGLAKKLSKLSESRGKDSSGILVSSEDRFEINKSNYPVSCLYKSLKNHKTKILLGHTRLSTNGNSDNQPIFKDNATVFHNGIILNYKDIWKKINRKPSLKIDTEIIAELANISVSESDNYKLAAQKVLDYCTGTISCCIYFHKLGKIILFSNNGSLFFGKKNGFFIFASEKVFLSKIKCQEIEQIFEPKIIDCFESSHIPKISNDNHDKLDLLPSFNIQKQEANLLIHRDHNLQRCTRCILPETMPFIDFDDKGVCNYCNNYVIRNKPKPREDLLKLLEPYTKNGSQCIIPLSGGRDSFFCLDAAIKLNLKPITYTYDWGMVTDLARRNISQICYQLGLENIVFAADIELKRKNIKKNLLAWLKSPHLGMISLLTAGDKHFFKHINDVKKDTGINLNLWGINPLETTHFKSGFLGVKPNFLEDKVYATGALNQLNYQKLRFKEFFKNPSYFNSSIFNTLSGEYYRTYCTKKDYFHIFDYWKWEEDQISKVLDKYSFEYANDTTCSWRIGDGTAGFYNYVYYNVAGFTEHDTFRSNQIREGDLSREEALKLIEEENQPRHESIKWYTTILGLDFSNVIKTVNRIKPLIYD